MARQTRQQRRERRERDGAGAEAASLTQRARTRQAQVRPAAQPTKSQTGSRRAPAAGTRRFIGESWAELRKVEWPGQSQLIQGTVVVLIACLIVGVFLYASDEAFKRLVENVFLR